MTYNRDVTYAGCTKETPIPVITRAPGTFSTLIRKYPDHIPVKHDTMQLQNTVTMGNAHILLNI